MKIETVRRSDPATFLSRLAVIAEGTTEVGFLTALLERTLAGPLDTYGIHVATVARTKQRLNFSRR